MTNKLPPINDYFWWCRQNLVSVKLSPIPYRRVRSITTSWMILILHAYFSLKMHAFVVYYTFMCSIVNVLGSVNSKFCDVERWVKTIHIIKGVSFHTRLELILIIVAPNISRNVVPIWKMAVTENCKNCKKPTVKTDKCMQIVISWKSLLCLSARKLHLQSCIW